MLLDVRLRNPGPCSLLQSCAVIVVFALKIGDESVDSNAAWNPQTAVHGSTNIYGPQFSGCQSKYWILLRNNKEHLWYFQVAIYGILWGTWSPMWKHPNRRKDGPCLFFSERPKRCPLTRATRAGSPLSNLRPTEAKVTSLSNLFHAKLHSLVIVVWIFLWSMALFGHLVKHKVEVFFFTGLKPTSLQFAVAAWAARGVSLSGQPPSL